MLFSTVQEHWKTFLADLEATGESPALPAFVVAEVDQQPLSTTLGEAFYVEADMIRDAAQLWAVRSGPESGVR